MYHRLGDNTLEQFKLVELDYKAYQKKIAAKELEDRKEKEKEILKQKEKTNQLLKIVEKERADLQIRTKLISGKLDSLINKENYTEAAQLFIEKNGELSLASYYNSIYFGLVQSYARDTVYLSDEITNQFIEKNKEKLKSFAPDNYTLQFGLNGDEKRYLDLKIDKKDVSIKKMGNKMPKVNKGDHLFDGIVISISEKEVIVCSTKPVGMGSFTEGQILCEQYKINGLPGRLPTPSELKSIFEYKNKLDSYEDNWYWTNKENGSNADHIGIQWGDQNSVSKEHRKYVFAVRTFPINYFEIPTTSYMKLTVTEDKNTLIKSEYSSGSNKPIYKIDENSYCLKALPNSKKVSFNYNTEAPKNSLIIEKTFENVKKINNKMIFKEVNTTKIEHVVSKKC